MQTISRTIQILRSFSKDKKELSLAEFHHKLGLSKSSLQRILNTLVNYGFLEKDDKRKTYRLGNELYYLGKLVEEHSHLLTVTKPYLKAIRDRLGESVYLNIIENNERKCIAFEEGKHDLMTISYIGQTSPLYAGASAKLLLAFLPPDKMTQYLQQTPLRAITDSTVIDKDKLLAELKDIRANGYASSYGERVIGVCSVSAPILNRWGETIAGVSIS
ncbi:MAG: hypothetical protein K0R47_5601, partial [Brevibacillus sp.]|nr:hypothetical protein [Brevibacillus sp.]